MRGRTERQSPYSLRRRLMVVMTGGFLVVLSLISIGLWSYARNAANETYDLLLKGSAISILERISLSPQGYALDFPPSALEILGLAEDDRVFYRVFDLSGTTITGDPDLPLPPALSPAETPIAFDAAYSGEPVRFVVQGRTLLGQDRPQWVGVQIGQTRSARNALHFNIFSTGLVGLTLLAVVSLVFVRVAISRAMRPLSGIEADIRRREPTDLSPLRAQPPREIESLIGTINDFMRRLDVSKDNAQTFIADVAHQIRTALATLEGHLQLAENKADGASMRLRLDKARDQTGRTINLTNQLLSHAMVIHRADNEVRETIDLKAVIASVLEEVVRSPAAAGAEFAFEQNLPDRQVRLTGDPLAVREALLNLVQNALQHGGKTISIELSRHRVDGVAHVVLAVEDDGPGIAPSERGQVTDRFYTLGESAGSGIGLAIVKAVVESHDGGLELGEAASGGLRAAMTLPTGE